MRVDRLSRWIARRVTPLILALAAAGAAAGFALGADAGGQDPSAELTDFFRASTQLMIALLIALALFQAGPSPVAGHGARRFLSLAVFPLLGVGLVASLAGLTHSMPDAAYRWAFSLVTGAGSAALITTLMVGAGNISAQHRQAIEARAREFESD